MTNHGSDTSGIENINYFKYLRVYKSKCRDLQILALWKSRTIVPSTVLSAAILLTEDGLTNIWVRSTV